MLSQSWTVLILLTVIQLLIQFATAQNVMISDANSPTEPAITIDPKNPSRIVAGANINNFFVSSDTGKTWTADTMFSSYGVWGDPVIIADTASNFYFFHLSNPPSGNWIDRIVCQKSSDFGSNWDDGTYVGLNGTKAQDKQWGVVDPTNNNIYLTWTQFDAYGSSNSVDSSLILFSKSSDGGSTWSAAMRINKVAGDCIDSDNTVEGAVPAVGPNGEIYVAWAGPSGIVFNRSLDEGNTWLSKEILIDSMPGGWDLDVPGIYRCNGLPVTKCDLSGGPNHGTIYVNWSDQRNGSNDTDVWLAKSTDGGDTWSTPIRVNNDAAGKHQFFTWMDIDQTNGNLFFVFYDRRNYNDNHTDVYLAFSDDGGNIFTNQRISESAFLPDAGIFFGDYTNISVYNGIVRPIWTRLHNAVLSIWTSVTPFEQLFTSNHSVVQQDIEALQFPNPAAHIIYVSFKLHEPAIVSLSLFNQQGKKIHSVFENEQRGFGKYIIPIRLDEIGLAKGLYHCKLSVNGKTKNLRMIVVE